MVYRTRNTVYWACHIIEAALENELVESAVEHQSSYGAPTFVRITMEDNDERYRDNADAWDYQFKEDWWFYSLGIRHGGTWYHQSIDEVTCFLRNFQIWDHPCENCRYFGPQFMQTHGITNATPLDCRKCGVTRE
jgi:hypothetical protein